LNKKGSEEEVKNDSFYSSKSAEVGTQNRKGLKNRLREQIYDRSSSNEKYASPTHSNKFQNNSYLNYDSNKPIKAVYPPKSPFPPTNLKSVSYTYILYFLHFTL
jgi:hypothetical protein